MYIGKHTHGYINGVYVLKLLIYNISNVIGNNLCNVTWYKHIENGTRILI